MYIYRIFGIIQVILLLSMTGKNNFSVTDQPRWSGLRNLLICRIFTGNFIWCHRAF